MLYPPREDVEGWARWVSAPFMAALGERSPQRALAKALTYRVLGSGVSAVVVAWVTGQPLTGLLVGLADFGVKLFVYYLHERLWACVGSEHRGSTRGRPDEQ